MKTIREHALFAAFIVFVFLVFCRHIPVPAAFLLGCIWYERTHDTSFLLITLLLLLFCIPVYRKEVPEITCGRVTEVHGSYIVVQNGRSKVLVYTKEIPVLDSVVSLDGEFRQISSHISFYGFDFSEYCSDRGIYWYADCDPVELKRSWSVRGWVQKRISMMDEEQAVILNRIIFGIRSERDGLNGWLNDTGFSLSGMIAYISAVLKRICSPEQRKKIIRIITFLTALVFHFPVILTVRIVFDLICTGHGRDDQRLGMALLAIMILMPYCVTSASFLFPVMFRLVSFEEKDRKADTLWYTSLMQSVLYRKINPAEILLYRFLRLVCGFLWCAALITVFLPFLPLAGCVRLIDKALSWIGIADIRGSLLGPGLPFFLALLVSLRSSDHYVRLRPLLLWVCLACGLMHPFAEVTFINVGQGDSILIRMPLNTHNILIDTGKPSYSDELDTILQAKSIRKIHTLFITHSDLDHSGNQDHIVRNYHTDQVITRHFDEVICGNVRFADLNMISNDDENQSSLVIYYELNGLSYLMTGDADEVTEKAVVRDYGNLTADILKVSHHGSSTGSSEELLDQLKPDLAVISAGAYNLYHHPSEQTLQRLLQRHIPYLNTREEGDITIVCLPAGNLLVTASGKFALLSSWRHKN
ncbi:MAG: MBL fold metallo-hydrolase [Solobacterium sp.]|nr:MBL fold metallo-hydrolase [Solobacterium sp.]